MFGSATPANRDLASLGSGGFRVDGAQAGDSSGWSVAGPGDVNGDGRADILIGADQADNNGRNTSGSTYVVFGSATPANRDLASLGSGGFRIDGALAGDSSGTPSPAPGDVNADGRADMLIGAPVAGNNGRVISGSSFVVFGSATPANRDLASLGSGGFRIDGAQAGDQNGYVVAAAGTSTPTATTTY